MNYEEFKVSVEKYMKQQFPKEDYEVSIRKVTKNNGLSLDGLCIFKKGVNASPTIYLESYYDLYKKGKILADVLQMIEGEYYLGMEKAPKLPYPGENYETVKNRIIMRLINYEKNAEILQECPFIRIYDLAISFRWLAHQDDIGISTALITYSEMERWGITKEQLFRDASANTPRIFPAHFAKLRDVVKDSGFEMEQADVELFVVTNEQGINGATSILYSDLLENIAQTIGSSYYLLPSSIHEMMICPAEERIGPSMLLSLVKEANHMVVTMGEVLSDNIYYYDRGLRRLTFIKQSDLTS